MAKTVYMRSANGEVFTTAHPQYHQDCERLTEKAGMDARRAYCIEQLRKMIKPGQKVYCMLRSVSKSGMSRVISLYIVHKGELKCIDVMTSDILLNTLADGGGMKVSGCGMDMGFALVYALSRHLFPNGFGVEGRDGLGRTVTPLSRAKAEKAVAAGFVFRGRNGDTSGWDNDGGYALTHDWM